MIITNCCSVREGENVLNQIQDDQVSLLLSNGSLMHRAMNGKFLVGMINIPVPPRILRGVHLKLATLHFPPAVFFEDGAVTIASHRYYIQCELNIMNLQVCKLLENRGVAF